MSAPRADGERDSANRMRRDARRLTQPTKQALRRIQLRLERYYALESAPNVADFASGAASGEREVLLVKECGAVIELGLRVPCGEVRTGANDVWLQLLEGVSHFVYVAERARIGLPATQLELELQAEIDKFVLLALEPGGPATRRGRELHRTLFDGGVYLHPPGSELGERYRLANALAARLSARLLERDAEASRVLLRRFYRAGQTEKIALARAA